MKARTLQKNMLFLGLLALASCLKDDPANNTSGFVGQQQIPNINNYIPQELLEQFGATNLFFGTNPPILIDFDNMGFFTESMQGVNPQQSFENQAFYFKFSNQHLGVAEMTFTKDSVGTVERWSTTKAYEILKDELKTFSEDSLAPAFFKNGFNDAEVFRHAYIMGRDPYFTAFYYEVLKEMQPNHPQVNLKPMNAVVMSGKLCLDTLFVKDTVISQTGDTIYKTDTTIIHNIKDFTWGVERMKYFCKEEEIETALENGETLRPGTIHIMKCDILKPKQN